MVQAEHPDVPFLGGDLQLGLQPLEDLLHVVGIAGAGDGLSMGLGVHPHLILPGHIQQVIQPPIPHKVRPGDTGGIIGVSEFEPDGGADWAYDDNPLEKVYFVLEGEMTVTDKDGNKYVIHKNESISFPPNEGRGLKNESGKPAKMLVIINYPDAQ